MRPRSRRRRGRILVAVLAVTVVTLALVVSFLRAHVTTAGGTTDAYPHENIVADIRRNMAAVNHEAEQHTLYVPRHADPDSDLYPWVKDAYAVEGELEFWPLSIDGVGMGFSQFAEQNYTRQAVGGWIPETLCKVGRDGYGKRGPAGTCLAVPGHDARFLWDTKAWDRKNYRRLVLVARMPGGTIVNIDAAANKRRFGDPVRWATRTLDSLAEVDYSHVSVEDLEEAGHVLIPG
jgi:hypothetical protein